MRISDWSSDVCSSDLGDAMVHALAVGDDVLIAERLEHGLGKQAAFDLGFLKAQDVGRFLAQEFLDDADTGADAVDVPGSDACHASALSGWGALRNAGAAMS